MTWKQPQGVLAIDHHSFWHVSSCFRRTELLEYVSHGARRANDAEELFRKKTAAWLKVLEVGMQLSINILPTVFWLASGLWDVQRHDGCWVTILIQKDFSSFFSAQTPGPGPAESELGLPAPWDSGWRWSDLVGLALPGIQKNSWLVVFDAKISTFLIPDTSSIFGIFHRAKGKFHEISTFTVGRSNWWHSLSPFKSPLQGMVCQSQCSVGRGE